MPDRFICGRTCGCDDLCPRGESMAEDRDYDHDGSMADREADRYERWIGGDA